MQPKQCAVLIPCRNEEDALRGLLPEISNYFPTVVVVDDGSRDGTAKVAREMGAQCIRFSPGRGKGAALQAGFAHLEETGFRHALTMDGDGQHSPSDIPRFLDCDADLIIGERDMSKMPPVRRVVNRAMSACLSRHTGCALPDSQCGFRLVDLRCAREADCRTRRFEFESEMLVNFIRRGFRVKFVPVQTIYAGERSKICALPDTWRWLKWFAMSIISTNREKFHKRSPALLESSAFAEK
jgi:glycosyltransferase involved in cell wall biosynthesis